MLSRAMRSLMGLVLMPVVLSLAGMSRAEAQATIAQEEEAFEYLLFMDIPAVYGISKKEESMKDVPMSVYVVSNDELDRWGVRGLYEVFQRIPGYSFYNTDHYGQYGVIGRGMQSVWRYGVNFELMNVVDFGHWEFTPHFFKNIEIARGPAGLMWGSGAEAGLMNLNIRDDVDGLETYLELGDYNRRAYDVVYGGNLGVDSKNSFFIGWHYEEQDAEIIKGALAEMDKASEDWKSNGINPSQSLISKVVYDDFKILLFQNHAAHTAPVLWYGDADLQNDLEESIGSDWGDQLEVIAYRLEYSVPLATEDFSLAFYHDYYRKQWQTESVATDVQRKRAFGFSAKALLVNRKLDVNFGGDLWGEDQTTAPSFTTIWAHENHDIDWYDNNVHPARYPFRNLYAQGKYSISDRLKGLLGVRMDYQKDDPESKTIYSGPRVGLFYDLSENLNMKYLYNSSVRRPQANEAGQGLSAERLSAHELIATVDIGDNLQLDVTLFRQVLEDQITRQNLTEDLNAFINTGGLTSTGAEWALKYSPLYRTRIYWNGSLQTAKVNKGSVIDPDTGNEVDVSEAHDNEDRSLFVPAFTSFVGCEVPVGGYYRINVALRTIAGIPYQTLSGDYSEKCAHFMDLSMRTKRTWNDRLGFSVAVINVLDNTDRLPAYGEHIGNASGLIPPEGRRVFGRIEAIF